jgi:copper transport protein
LRRRAKAVLWLVALGVALALPGAASAHAYLVHTVPSAAGVLNTPPSQVALTYDEAVEPRFALISVTDAAGTQEATAMPQRSPANPDTLVVPVRPDIPEGWYLVYWRAISVDGHPVQGAFTFAVGPNPGPAPEFSVPTIAQTATARSLVAWRWIVFLTVMSAIGLAAFRLAVARPLVTRVAGASLRAVTVACVVACVAGLVAIPVYLLYATAGFSLRSVWAVGALVPLFRTTAFGRGYVDLELCFALFCAAAWLAIRVDRPERAVRSVAEILAGVGAFAAAAAVLIIPGASGHSAQTSPRGLSLALDWLHLASGSLWLGGLVGLLLLWRTLPAAARLPGLALVVPRFSNLAFCSVAVLLGTGIAATVIHMPILAALWQTSYGQAILVKGGLLAAAMALGAFNLLRTKPALAAADEAAETRARAVSALRYLVGGETALLVGAVLVAAILTSLAPPPAALAREGSALARVGPGRVATVVHAAGYTLRVLVSPNQAVATNSFSLEIDRNGVPLQGADVTLTFGMLDMQMADQQYQLTETRPSWRATGLCRST